MSDRTIRLNLRISQDELEMVRRLSRLKDRTPSRLLMALARDSELGSQREPRGNPEGTQREPNGNLLGTQREPNGCQKGGKGVGYSLSWENQQKKPITPLPPLTVRSKKNGKTFDVETEAWISRMFAVAEPYVGNALAARKMMRLLDEADRPAFEQAIRERDAQGKGEFNPLHRMAQAGNWKAFDRPQRVIVPIMAANPYPVGHPEFLTADRARGKTSASYDKATHKREWNAHAAWERFGKDPARTGFTY